MVLLSLLKRATTFGQNKQGKIDYTTINRKNNSRHQIIDNLSFAIDNRFNKQFDLYGIQHDINIGFDAFQEKVTILMINMVMIKIVMVV